MTTVDESCASVFVAEEQMFAGRTIDVPACFIAGKSDWGIYQKAGELKRLQSAVCKHYAGTHLLDGAGHWVQQEQPARVVEVLLAFLNECSYTNLRSEKTP